MSDIIAAIATPRGVGAIGIIRMSGAGCIELAESLFTPHSGRPFSRARDRALVLGRLKGADGRTIDECLATKSRAPNSYTGEDTVEFQCHGGITVLSEALRSVFKAGARQALAGEFTKRAFLNGRMDLVQAEAVVDLIDAETPAAAMNAAGQLGGAMSRRIEAIYSGLLDIMAHFHAVLDWPDEDIEPFEAKEIAELTEKWSGELKKLSATFSRGRLLKDGVRCAIIGRPNAGKSSLLNALAGYERAIVTDIPGTTRDTIEERVLAGGVLLRLTDTAGLRRTADVIEELGVKRAMEAADGADLVIAVLDGSEDWSAEDAAFMDTLRRYEKSLCVISKSDLARGAGWPEIPGALSVSSVSGEGMEELGAAIAALFPAGSDAAAGEILTNARQADAVERAEAALHGASEALEAGFTPDAVLVGVEEALAALGELTGKTVRDDVTQRIFERFCVGK